MPQLRLSLLVPVSTKERQAAGRLALEKIRKRFPRGGSWLSTPSLEPVVFGWWKGSRPKRIDDAHLLVWVDISDSDPITLKNRTEAAISYLREAFVTSFAGPLAEDEIYFYTQPIEVHSVSGKASV